MTNPDEDLLVAPEGVDEGSAASTVEGPDTGGSPVTGGGSHHAAQNPAAPPVDAETPDTRAAKQDRGTGQQLEVGEG